MSAMTEKFLAKHTKDCKTHVFSGDRRCSCGRDATAAELAQYKEALMMARTLRQGFHKGDKEPPEWVDGTVPVEDILAFDALLEKLPA